MEFSIKSGGPERIRSGCIIIGVFEPRKLSAAGASLDRASRGQLTAALKRGDMEGKAGTTLMLHQVPRVSAARVLLVGLGREREFDDGKYRSAVTKAIAALKQTGVTDAVLCLPAGVKQRDIAWRAAQAAIAASDAAYHFDRMKSKREQARGVRHLTLLVGERSELKAGQSGLKQGAAIAHGMSLAKDLGNLPGNVCTPAYLADAARTLARQYKLGVQVLERKDMEKLGMGSLLSVARGSDEPPKLIVLKYEGGPRGQKPYALVGKGVTFDTGGISLKPSAGMWEMKCDMAGAATALAGICAAAALKLPINVSAVLCLAENRPGNAAVLPGDIFKAKNGKTVMVDNTDAEGRLVLSDGLFEAGTLKASHIIDIATLTGAVVRALGPSIAGLFSNDESFGASIKKLGRQADEKFWELPVEEEYRPWLDDPTADIRNVTSKPEAGAITAALFLSEFVPEGAKWSHWDVAGTAFTTSPWKYFKPGATGFGLKTLVEIARHLAE